MLAYLIRRLFAAAVMLVVIILVVFCIFFLVPKWAGVDIALNFVGKQADPAAVEGVREKLGLGDPVFVQAWEFFKGIFAGRTYAAGGDVTHCAAPCFGYSFKTEQSVWPVLTERFPVTLALALGAAVLWLIFGVAAGVLSALKRGTLWDRGAMVVALAGVSLPIYFTGLLSLAIFSYGLGWIDGEFVPLEDSLTGWLGGMILPWITLAFLYAAMYARITRATMLEILGEDYIRTARAKGLKEQVVISKHAMRSTLTPLLTMLGMDLGALMGGAILTETTFSLPGLGQKVLDAIKNHDLPFILGVVLITSLAVLIANLVVDILYAVIDPRVRLA
ncbi:ABC transporter permease [Streptomyces violaceoruber]|uniref:Oligopeptide transport system integral membrane protein n=6 Tax=Streptomyces TaxID=1883 RepID=O86573_STRCO|nr:MULTISPECIES: ABC transporter permease [Streptomyces]MYU44998.1 ABC transporter permease subunit [Streptomyces sp. SID7813]QSJ08739.1 oligopeptide transport system integral membrane protein [Streptomyces lividans]AIJ13217.1 oligopeptide transport system integral membrane protein [Streptomyces lividans TK24]EFD66591.1 oligopeptide transport system integral membrane protein [Streptomyces lividans TK24]EOY50456.1 ABC transporter permease protein [Streptomyces lividans 1326]